MTLYERTINLSKQRGYSLKNLAIKAGLAENSIYDWKKSTPKADNLQKVADVLNVSTDYLLGRSENMNSFSNPDSDEASGLGQSIMMAFDGKDIPDEDKEKLLEFARFLKSQRGR